MRSLKIYWLQMGFFTDAQTVLKDDQTNIYGIFGKYLEIYLGYLGFSTGAQTVLRSLPDQLNQAPEIHLGYNFTENSEEQT